MTALIEYWMLFEWTFILEHLVWNPLNVSEIWSMLNTHIYNNQMINSGHRLHKATTLHNSR